MKHVFVILCSVLLMTACGGGSSSGGSGSTNTNVTPPSPSVGGSVGSLTFSGPDVGRITTGATFSPTVNPGNIQGVIFWSVVDPIVTSNTTTISYAQDVVQNPARYMLTVTSDSAFRPWILETTGTPILVEDTAAKSMTFNNVMLFDPVTNQQTLTLNGTLYYQ